MTSHATFVSLIAIFLTSACNPHPPTPPEKVPVPDAAPRGPIVFGEWKSLSFGSYLSPTGEWASTLAAGAFDVIWAFHACRAADKDWRSLDVPIVIVCINNLGAGTTPYSEAFADHARFGKLEEELTQVIAGEISNPDAHIGKTTLMAWSAGYASIQQILAVNRYYDATSSVVLLDGLHAGYVRSQHGKPTKDPNLAMIGALLKFADDAAAGKKIFAFTHSSIVTYDYASTTEVAAALEARLQMTRSDHDDDFPNAIDVADSGNMHIRGFNGQLAKDHIAQLHWLVPVLKKWVLPVSPRAMPNK